jgi:pimeloyl-ACP methyl ester carboxylesterase
MRPRTDELRLADGRRLAYGEAGLPDGVPIVYHHASTGCRFIPDRWHREAVAAGVRLIAPERPGYGRSDFQPRRRLLDWPHDFAALCDALDIERCGICGLSGGGPYVVATAYALPDLVGAAATMASLAPLDSEAAHEGLLPWVRADFATVTAQGPEALHAAIEQRVAAVQADPQALRAPFRVADVLGDDEDEMLTYLLETCVLEANARGPAGTAHETWIYTQPWGFALRDVTAPVDVWHGDADDMGPLHHARRLATEIPRARLRLWPGGTHFTGVVQFGAVLYALRDMLLA